MAFGNRVRELRHAKGWSLRDLASKVGVGFTYLSRVETGRLNFGDYPSDALIHRLSEALDAEEEELLVLAERIPERIKERVLQRPDVFGLIAEMSDDTLDEIVTRYRRKANKAKSR
ncbi:MAG TPA: helix-turn-helix transcriptional regulator [Gemmataceae bacterium]|nr:helix-turn-helix transcriptional regulator [Pirellulales bacterium]HZZ79431.1 helix-turn-helix transcriptional regulator [Gemmataceae bacterium]